MSRSRIRVYNKFISLGTLTDCSVQHRVPQTTGGRKKRQLACPWTLCSMPCRRMSTLRSPAYAYPCEKEAFLAPCAQQAGGPPSSSRSYSSKVRPPRLMPPTATRHSKQPSCPASRAATLSRPPFPPLAPRLPASHVRHSRARDVRQIPGSARDNARSPSFCNRP